MLTPDLPTADAEKLALHTEANHQVLAEITIYGSEVVRTHRTGEGLLYVYQGDLVEDARLTTYECSTCGIEDLLADPAGLA